MRAELPAFSFLSVVFILLILPGQLKSNNIPAVSIIAWLFVCNLIHGVNAILWANNVDIRASAWCDLVTAVLLGAMVAVPGAFLCVARQLDLMTTRTDTGLKPEQRHKKPFEILMCIVLPVVYIALHPIVQNRRFTIVRDLGCQAAVYNSLPALILVWLPPLLLSGIALLYCLSAAINIGKARYTLSPYFPYNPDMTMSLFGRRLAFALSGMAYSAVVYGIIASSVSLQSWTSISAIRTDVSRIEVLNDRGWRTRSELIWWATPIWSLLLCTMSACGEETRSGYRSLYKLVMRGFERDVLPVHKAKSLTMTEPTTPVHLLKSGWDDALNVKKSHSTLRSTFTLNSHSDSTRSSTPTPPQSPPPPMSPEQDASFTQSTLTYLESSTARQLRLPSPPPPALHLVHPPGPAERTYPPSPDDAHPPPHHRFSALALSPPNPHYSSDMSGSPASSILSADAWPKPPPTVPSPTSAHPYARSSSPTSITSSIVAGQLDALGYPVYPGEHTVSPRMRPADLPFNVEGPSVMSVPFSPPTAARRTASVHSTKSRHVHGAKGKKNDVIYMTVVKETVVGEAA